MGSSDGVDPEGAVLVGGVGMLCSVLPRVTVSTGLFSTVAELSSRLAGGRLWEGIRTYGINYKDKLLLKKKKQKTVQLFKQLSVTNLFHKLASVIFEKP